MTQQRGEQQRWRVQWYGHAGDWVVADDFLEVFGTTVLASFEDKEKAEKFCAAQNEWERNLKPPDPSDFGGWPEFGRERGEPIYEVGRIVGRTREG